MEKIRHQDEELFFEAVLSLQTQEDCKRFFEDICTIKELQSITQRFRVAGASSATISRVNRCLNYGSGYREALDNLKKAGKLDDDGSGLEK